QRLHVAGEDPHHVQAAALVGLVVAGGPEVAHSTARSVVTAVASRSSQNRTKLTSRGPWLSSLNPSARRMARYSPALARSALTGRPPATGGPAAAARSGRPWHRSRSTACCGAAAPARPRAAM